METGIAYSFGALVGNSIVRTPFARMAVTTNAWNANDAVSNPTRSPRTTSAVRQIFRT